MGSELELPLPEPAVVSPRSQEDAAYAELRREIREGGLFDKRLGFYAGRSLIVGGMLCISLLVLLLSDSLLVQLCNGAFLALTFGQIALLMHDAGHRQIFRSTLLNDLAGYLYGNLLLGFSSHWWIVKHNKHHAEPNQLDADPDLEFPVVAFTEEQALSKPWIYRPFIKYQGFLFIPLLTLETLSLRYQALEHLVLGRSRRTWLEAILWVLHVVVYLGVLFLLLEPLTAVAFILVNQALFGVYLGAIFAPNHKGMLVLESDHEMTFLEQQVVTARNVRGHPVTDFLFGGLNYQIEHHLLPALPRCNLPKAQKIVKRHCSERDLSYYETGPFRSYWEVLCELHRVSAPVRAGSRR